MGETRETPRSDNKDWMVRTANEALSQANAKIKQLLQRGHQLARVVNAADDLREALRKFNLQHTSERLLSQRCQAPRTFCVCGADAVREAISKFDQVRHEG